MLKSRNPWPQVGSYSLYEGEGAQQPVRILQLIDGGLVQVSFVERPEASGHRTILLADLPNCDQLDDADRDEMAGLGTWLRGRRRPRAAGPRRAEYDAQAAAWEELRARSIRAPILDRLLEEQDKRERARRAPPFLRRTASYA